MRFGWISEEALPKNASVDSFSALQQSATLTQATVITDDPLFSKNALLTLPQGTTVALLSKMGEWAYIEATSGSLVRGFVPVSSLVYMENAFNNFAGSMPVAAQVCTVNNPDPKERLHLRSKPSMKAQSLGKYYNGVVATVLTGEENGWIHVRIGSQTGYMQAKFLSFAQPVLSAIPTVAIQNTHGTGLHLRDAQSIYSQSLGLYPNNTPVAIWGLTDKWCHVMTMDGKMGFMLLSGFEKEIQYDLNKISGESPTRYATINAPTTLFKSINPIDEDGITNLNPPDRVKVLKKGVTWTKVHILNFVGYVPTAALNFEP